MPQVDGLRSEVLEVVHDDLLSVGHEDGDSSVLRVLFEGPLGLEDLGLDLLKTGQVDLVEDLLLNLFKVLLLKLDLFAHLVDLLLKVVHFLFVDADLALGVV